MTWTFGNDPATSTRDAVRLYVGDTDTTDQLVSDETIAWSLSDCGNVVIAASARIARFIAVSFARQCDLAAGDTKQSLSQRAKQYLALTRELDQMVIGGIGTGVVVCTPIVTGVSVSEMDAVLQDPDRPQAPWPESEIDGLDVPTALRPQ